MRKTIIMILFSLIGSQARSENFSCMVQDAEITGTEYSLTCRLNGEEIEMDLPEGMLLKGIDTFGDGVIAITKGKHILFWDSPFDKARKIFLDMKGEFIGLDAGDEICYAVSDSSEIVSLNLALIGKVFDFNGEYSGYYGNLRIIDIATGPASVCIAAEREDGSPAAFVSGKGSVWSERELNYRSEGIWRQFEKIPLSVTYEEDSDSFVLICNEGWRFHLPSCSHCNYIERDADFSRILQK